MFILFINLLLQIYMFFVFILPLFNILSAWFDFLVH